MRFGSVCSGIEAASCAWEPLGWKAQFVSEIEPFPCSVLAHHYPSVPNLGDMTKFKEWENHEIDVLVGGTPCQSFSVAGLRKGLDDPRGNLMLTYLAIADKYRPKWLVWENVPGVLSSNDGKDFGAFLGGLAELGYGFAYRVLDAQHFGVPQRRRRVFVVGCLGDWRSAAAVLFERHGLQGHPAPRRQAGKGTAGVVARSLAIRGRDGTPQAELGDEVANALLTPSGGRAGIGIGAIMTEALCVATGQAGTGIGADITHTLRGEGIDASEDGIGSGTPLTVVGSREIAGTRASNYGKQPDSSDSSLGPNLAIAFAQNQRDEVRTMEVVGALAAEPGAKQQTYMMTGMQVRRLTPPECEALQGFKRNYTLVPHRGKPAADGNRYKALGNSMAVPVMRWLGERIQRVDELCKSINAKDAA